MPTCRCVVDCMAVAAPAHITHTHGWSSATATINIFDSISGIIGTYEGHWEDIQESLPSTWKGFEVSQAIKSHRKAINMSLEDMANNLVKVLGRVLVAGIVGVRNPKTVSRWANGDVESVRDRYSEERLLALHQIVNFLQEYETDDTIRAFMIGMNPTLDDSSPASQLKNGHYADVMGAAKVLVTGGFS